PVKAAPPVPAPAPASAPMAAPLPPPASPPINAPSPAPPPASTAVRLPLPVCVRLTADVSIACDLSFTVIEVNLTFKTATPFKPPKWLGFHYRSCRFGPGGIYCLAFNFDRTAERCAKALPGLADFGADRLSQSYGQIGSGRHPQSHLWHWLHLRLRCARHV